MSDKKKEEAISLIGNIMLCSDERAEQVYLALVDIGVIKPTRENRSDKRYYSIAYGGDIVDNSDNTIMGKTTIVNTLNFQIEKIKKLESIIKDMKELPIVKECMRQEEFIKKLIGLMKNNHGYHGDDNEDQCGEDDCIGCKMEDEYKAQ